MSTSVQLPYWYRAAHILRQRLREVEDDESSLSEEVLTEGRKRRHYEVLAKMSADALSEAEIYIRALEQDRETERIAAYKRAQAHFQARSGDAAPIEDDGSMRDAALLFIDPVDEGLRTLWFRTRDEAVQYATNARFAQRPERRRVWVDRRWREEWSLRVPQGKQEVECQS